MGAGKRCLAEAGPSRARLPPEYLLQRQGEPQHEGSLFCPVWWARQGSNLRPIGYEPTALPLSYGPKGVSR